MNEHLRMHAINVSTLAKVAFFCFVFFLFIEVLRFVQKFVICEGWPHDHYEDH